MKLEEITLSEWFGMTITAVVLVAVITIGVMSVTTEEARQQQQARCKTLQGEYGGGKCFKGGKEI